jgi:hypothetical protein
MTIQRALLLLLPAAALVGCLAAAPGEDQAPLEGPVGEVEQANTTWQTPGIVPNNPLTKRSSAGNPANCNNSPSCVSTLTWNSDANSNNCCYQDAKGVVTKTGIDEATNWFYWNSQQCISSTSEGCSPKLHADGTWSTGTTLSQWLNKFGISEQPTDGTLDTFRQSNAVAVYYNVEELGLGRALGCNWYWDTAAPLTSGRWGFACFVTNYGETMNDQNGPVPSNYPRTFALEDAVLNKRAKNTVVISFQPSLAAQYGADYGTQFAAFDGEGHQIPYAQLDYYGARAVPGVCTECHGGTYQPSVHLVKGARFLPVNPSWVRFADTPGSPLVGRYPNYTRAEQEKSIGRINYLTLRANWWAGQYGAGKLLSQVQQDWLKGLYSNSSSFQDVSSYNPPTYSNPAYALTKTDGRSAPPNWRSPSGADAGHCGASGVISNGRNCQATEDLWSFGAGPQCGTCHMALEGTSLQMISSYGGFKSWWSTASADIGAMVMPHTQPAVNRFWGAYISLDDTSANYLNSTANRPLGKNNYYISELGSDGSWRNYGSAKVFLNEFMNHEVNGATQDPGLPAGLGCTWDSECGDASSGRICYKPGLSLAGLCMDGCGTRSSSTYGSAGNQPFRACPGEFRGDAQRTLAQATTKNRQECLDSSVVAIDGAYQVGPQCVSCGRLGQRACLYNKPPTVWPQSGVVSGIGCTEGSQVWNGSYYVCQ